MVTRGHCRGGSVPDCDPLGSNIYHAKFHALFTKCTIDLILWA